MQKMTRIQVPELANCSASWGESPVRFDEQGIAFVDALGLDVLRGIHRKTLVVLEEDVEVEDLKPAEIPGELVHSEEAGTGEGTKIGDFESAPGAQPLPEATPVEAPVEAEREAPEADATSEPAAAEAVTEEPAKAKPKSTGKRGPGRPKKNKAGR